MRALATIGGRLKLRVIYCCVHWGLANCAGIKVLLSTAGRVSAATFRFHLNRGIFFDNFQCILSWTFPLFEKARWGSVNLKVGGIWVHKWRLWTFSHGTDLLLCWCRIVQTQLRGLLRLLVKLGCADLLSQIGGHATGGSSWSAQTSGGGRLDALEFGSSVKLRVCNLLSCCILMNLRVLKFADSLLRPEI